MAKGPEQRYRGIFSHPAPLMAATVAGSAALWVLFVGSVGAHEMVVGAGSVLLTALFARTVFRRATLPFEPRWRDLAEAWRLPGSLVADCWVILRVLVRDLAGYAPQAVFVTAPFTASKSDPERIGSMVLAIGYLTMTPNSIVIGVDPARSLILYHQIERTPEPVLIRRLGAPR